MRRYFAQLIPLPLKNSYLMAKCIERMFYLESASIYRTEKMGLKRSGK
jgi:hypothetical protein